MTPVQRPPVFVPRASYRQRRMRDMARLLPMVGAVLFLIPLIWPQRGDDGGATGDVQMTSDAIIYVFGTWVVLIALAALVGRLLGSDDPATDPAGKP
jgi:hypothetical protein